MASTTRYARSGDVSIAYQVVGSGPVDLVFAPGFVSHMELAWEDPLIIQAKSSRAPTAGSVARRLTAGSTAFNLTLAKRVPTRLVVPPLLKWRTFHEATDQLQIRQLGNSYATVVTCQGGRRSVAGYERCRRWECAAVPKLSCHLTPSAECQSIPVPFEILGGRHGTGS